MNFGMNFFRTGGSSGLGQCEKPTLIEPGVKSFFSGVLKGCNQIRSNHYNTIFNVSMFALFIFLLSSILYFKYKGKLTPEEKERKIQQEKQYILTRLNNVSAVINMDRQKVGNITNANLITDLPGW